MISTAADILSRNPFEMNYDNNSEDFMIPAGAEVNIIPVMPGEEPARIDENRLPDRLAILALRNAVIFPGTIFPVNIGRDKSVRLIHECERNGMLIGAVPQIDVAVEDPHAEDLCTHGTAVRIMKTLEMPDGTMTAILQGIKRIVVDNIITYEPYINATVHYVDEFINNEKSKENQLIMEALKEKAGAIMKTSSMMGKEAIQTLRAFDDFRMLTNFVATTVEVDNFADKAALLEYDDLKERAMKLLTLLDIQLQFQNIKQEINRKVKGEIDQQQREFFLNNKLRTIQEELGMDDSGDFEKLRQQAASKDWPKEAAENFEKELMKLERYNPSSPDYSIQYNFLKFMHKLDPKLVPDGINGDSTGCLYKVCTDTGSDFGCLMKWVPYPGRQTGGTYEVVRAHYGMFGEDSSAHKRMGYNGSRIENQSLVESIHANMSAPGARLKYLRYALAGHAPNSLKGSSQSVMEFGRR